ncbi:MAG: hypothetical protein R3324_15405, partial [Halobacteriales archaeon]|nr:hypothetical protein [Halobacteriales archaeon]
MKSRIPLLTVAVLFFFASTPSPAQTFEAIWEPPGPGAPTINAISPNGNHVLFSYNDPNLGTLTYVWSKDSGVKEYGRIQYVDATTSVASIHPSVVSDDGRPSATGEAAVRPGDGQAWGQAYAWVDGAFSLIEVEGHTHRTAFPHSVGLVVSADGSTFTGRMRFPSDGSGQFPNDGSKRYFLSKDGSAALFPTPPVGAKFVTGPAGESMTADGGMVLGKICDLFARNCEFAIWNGSEYIRSGLRAGNGESIGAAAISPTGTAALVGGMLWTGCPIADSLDMRLWPAGIFPTKVRAEGTMLFARETGTNESGIWTTGTGFLNHEEAVREFLQVPEGWTNMTVVDMSDDGTVWVGVG